MFIYLHAHTHTHTRCVCACVCLRLFSIAKMIRFWFHLDFVVFGPAREHTVDVSLGDDEGFHSIRVAVCDSRTKYCAFVYWMLVHACFASNQAANGSGVAVSRSHVQGSLLSAVLNANVGVCLCMRKWDCSYENYELGMNSCLCLVIRSFVTTELRLQSLCYLRLSDSEKNIGCIQDCRGNLTPGGAV